MIDDVNVLGWLLTIPLCIVVIGVVWKTYHRENWVAMLFGIPGLVVQALIEARSARAKNPHTTQKPKPEPSAPLAYRLGRLFTRAK
jgi:hypothetical protein